MRRSLVILFLSLWATRASAQIGFYESEDPGLSTCNELDYTNSVQDVYVIVTGEWKSARFSIPRDQLIVPIDLQPMNGTTVGGDLYSGFTLTFSSCTSDRQTVARLTVIVACPCSLCGFGPSAHPATGYVELVDCAGHSTAATWIAKLHVRGGPNDYCFDGVSPLPRHPYPANGEAGISINPDLTWIMDYPVGWCDGGDRLTNLYLGTTPSPPLLIYDIVGQGQHVDALQPGTTYYWKLWVNNYGYFVESPLWSFTTAGGPVATTPTTWGAVKALYRE